MTNETIADIVAEMRNHASGSAESAWYTPESWRQLCDRIEAAHKRENKTTLKQAQELITELEAMVAMASPPDANDWPIRVCFRWRIDQQAIQQNLERKAKKMAKAVKENEAKHETN